MLEIEKKEKKMKKIHMNVCMKNEVSFMYEL